MTLKEYLEGKSRADFAREIGVSPSLVTLWCKGERFPRPEIVLKIQKLTRDSVRVADWYNLKE